MQQRTYSDKLKDPRWQKKRLKILERDKWCCQICSNERDTLNVHHLEYTKGLMPWEYNDDELVTICEYHHEFVSLCKIPKILIVFWLKNKNEFDPVLPEDKYLISEKFKQLFRDFIIGARVGIKGPLNEMV